MTWNLDELDDIDIGYLDDESLKDLGIVDSGPRFTVSEVITLEESQAMVQDEIDWAQTDFAEGAVSMVSGTVQMVRALTMLQKDDLYKKSALVVHYDTPATWGEYLRELVAWTKEHNPEVQISMSGLKNLLWRQKVLVGYFGFDEATALGANETMVRQIRNMAQFDYKTGEPVRLKDGYTVDKLPVPPDTDDEERLSEGLKVVIEDALNQPIINTKMFDDYKRGTGKIETKVSFQVVLDDNAMLRNLVGFVQKFDADGKPLADYAINLLTEVWSCEITDRLLDCGWNVDFV